METKIVPIVIKVDVEPSRVLSVLAEAEQIPGFKFGYFHQKTLTGETTLFHERRVRATLDIVINPA